MQLGGNANAQQFFADHNCQMSDTQQKYHSKTANLYRAKLLKLAEKSIEEYPNRMELQFTEIENFTSLSDEDKSDNVSLKSTDGIFNCEDNFNNNSNGNMDVNVNDNVELSKSAQSKQTVNIKKPPLRKLGVLFN